MESNSDTSRFTTPPTSPPEAAPTAEESLVSDARAGLTPAEMVEQKLVLLLASTPLPTSRLQPINEVRPLS